MPGSPLDNGGQSHDDALEQLNNTFATIGRRKE
jgi:hypothetical protein